MLSFGRILSLLLEDRDWTHQEFADRVGVDRSTISKAVRGKHATELKYGPVWADAFGLTGRERHRFLLALGLVNSPPIVQRDFMRRPRRAK